MTDWTAILAALGVSAPVAVPLALALRWAVPEALHALRVWRVDRALGRAAGLMHSLRVADGLLATPLDRTELARLVSAGRVYMETRLASTLATLGVSGAQLEVMVQAEFGDLLSRLATPAAGPSSPARCAL